MTPEDKDLILRRISGLIKKTVGSANRLSRCSDKIRNTAPNYLPPDLLETIAGSAFAVMDADKAASDIGAKLKIE